MGRIHHGSSGEDNWVSGTFESEEMEVVMTDLGRTNERMLKLVEWAWPYLYNFRYVE